jgi:hypothetical protein
MKENEIEYVSRVDVKKAQIIKKEKREIASVKYNHCYDTCTRALPRLIDDFDAVCVPITYL